MTDLLARAIYAARLGLPAPAAPTYPQESAVLITLNPGAYTVIVEGVGESTGIALVSVNDLDNLSAAGRLVNISTRADASTSGDEQVIAGFIIQGGSKKVLLRGFGPGLASAGVAGALSDPEMTLFSGSSAVVSNDDWGSSAEANAIGSLDKGTLQTKESAIYRQLGEGAYTVIMHGKTLAEVGLIAVDE